MNQSNPQEGKTKEINVVAGLKVIETEYRVKSAVFEDEIVKRPIFVEEKVKVPTGWDSVINELALEISKAVIAIVESSTNKQLKLLEDKIASLRNVKTEEEVVLKTKEVEVEKPVYKNVDVEITRPVYVDKEVINPILKNVDVTNAIVIDKAVTNAVITDVRVTNSIIKDVEVERAVIREKVIDVIHPRYLNMKGEPEV